MPWGACNASPLYARSCTGWHRRASCDLDSTRPPMWWTAKRLIILRTNHACIKYQQNLYFWMRFPHIYVQHWTFERKQQYLIDLIKQRDALGTTSRRARLYPDGDLRLFRSTHVSDPIRSIAQVQLNMHTSTRQNGNINNDVTEGDGCASTNNLDQIEGEQCVYPTVQQPHTRHVTLRYVRTCSLYNICMHACRCIYYGYLHGHCAVVVARRGGGGRRLVVLAGHLLQGLALGLRH